MSIRNPGEAGNTITQPFPAAVQLFRVGEIVMIDSSGYATPGATATGQLPGGVVATPCDNSGGSAGDLSVNVTYGGYFVEVDNGSGADAVLATDRNAPVYTLDRNAVSRVSSGKSKLGIFKGFSPSGRVRVLVSPN